MFGDVILPTLALCQMCFVRLLYGGVALASGE